MKKDFTLGKTRSVLYKTAKFFGDINAIKQRTIGRRMTNRAVGKVSGKISEKITKGIFGFFK